MKSFSKSILIVLMGVAGSLGAQRKSQPIEVGITLGGANYLGNFRLRWP